MGAFQWSIVAIATILMMTEGYDVQAMAFTANAVTTDLGLTSSQLGLILSGGLIGMALGTAGVGPFADRYGRKPVLLVSLCVNALGLFMTGLADSMPELLLWRVVTGLGIGGTMTSGVVLVSEYANSKYRALALSVYSAGFPVGATIGGLAAVPLIGNFGWQAVFLLGGMISLVAIAAVFFAIPESIDNLASRYHSGNDKTMHQAERIARRLGIEGPVVFAATSTATGARQRNSYARLFASENRGATIKLWIIYFLVMSSFYFVSSWTPQLLVQIGLTAEQGIYGGLVVMAGGLVGNVLYGSCAARWNPKIVMSVFAVVASALMVGFSMTTSVLFLALGLGLLLGVFINGCMAAIYTLAPMTYTADLRSTGVGMAMGFGRVGSILAPILVGNLLDLGWTPIAMYILFAVVILIPASVAPRLPSQFTPRTVTENRSAPPAPADKEAQDA